MTVLAYDPERRTNAQAIAELAALGFLRDDDVVLDMTVEPKGAFWKRWRPSRSITNDIDPAVAADLHADGQAMPCPRWAVDVSVWDPPYKYEGARSKGNRDQGDRYGNGTNGYLSPSEIDARLLAGTAEALRITRRLALVKCQKQNVASEFRFPDQPFAVAQLAQRHGAMVVAGSTSTGLLRSNRAGKRELNVLELPLRRSACSRARREPGRGRRSQCGAAGSAPSEPA